MGESKCDENCRKGEERILFPLPKRERIEGEGPYSARILCARFKILLVRVLLDASDLTADPFPWWEGEQKSSAQI